MQHQVNIPTIQRTFLVFSEHSHHSVNILLFREHCYCSVNNPTHGRTFFRMSLTRALAPAMAYKIVKKLLFACFWLMDLFRRVINSHN
ncbi:hypothetical protein HanIR_Chr09g0402971 [Helianthus annuus]|nr:hypothetical protein HanIR_Chr09g0402971 [Helianthus annuus]